MQWVNHTRWNLAWREISQIKGGGQASAKRAARLADGEQAFLKILNRNKDAERRARFFREATAYSIFSHWGMPRLIESNAHLHNEADPALYLATEWINGFTLRELIIRRRLALEQDYTMTMALLETLAVIHAGDVVHRDIKPDNIILRDNDPAKPVLLDFGITYHSMSGVDFSTEHGQEIGNRFLRLPELAPNSPAKQDARSDLTFAAGILLYAITGEPPDLLLDGDGRLPHQRDPRLQCIREVAGSRSALLLLFFDQAFQQRISDRFLSATEMKRLWCASWMFRDQAPRNVMTSPCFAAESTLPQVVGRVRQLTASQRCCSSPGACMSHLRRN